MKSKKKVFVLGVQLVLIGFGVYFSYLVAKEKLSVEDAHALYGGQVEYNYKSAGFLINYTTNNSIKQCGYAALSKTIGITAAHCVEDGKVLYVGTGEFNPSNVVQVNDALAREGWIKNKDRLGDFAVLNFQGDSTFTDFAEIGTPKAGCNYRVVAYGRTEDPSSAKLRKSALLCASNINAVTFQIQGYNSGICFGDSGSPVYVDGTNTVVGVVVSIINSANPNEPCNISNQATVMRADANTALITGFIQTTNANSGSNGNTNSNVTSVSVAEESFLDKIGLSYLQTLTEKDKETYLVIFLVAVSVSLIGVMVYLIASASKTKKQQNDNPLMHVSTPLLGYQIPPV